jgi:dsRNA-specific ribonuclease
MAEPKSAAKEYQVFYQTPLILSQPFKRAAESVTVYSYEMSIPDVDLTFKILSASFVGPLYQTSQKTSIKVGHDTHAKRQKVFARFIAEEQISTAAFTEYVGTHQNFFQSLIARNFNDHYLNVVPPIERLPETIEYKNLIKQYLVTNEFIIRNFQKPILACSLEDKKISPKTASLNKIYFNQEEDNFYVVRHIFEPCQAIQLNKFAEGIFDLYYPPEERLNSSSQVKTLESFLRSEMDMKTTQDLLHRSKPLPEFLETLLNKHNTSDIMKGLAKLVSSREDVRWKSASICVAVPAVKFGDFDYNYMEGCLSHQTNQELSQNSVAELRQQVVFLFSDRLNETPWDIKTFDAHLRIPCTLIQFQRMAQQFEYKQAMDFQFIKDHLMFKALSSRAQDPCNNNETLETLGDSALKVLTIMNLYVNNSDKDEGWMTTQKSSLVSNENLADHVSKSIAVYYLKDKYNKIKSFVPPFLEPVGENHQVHVVQEDAMIIAKKMLADCFEATVGAALVSSTRLFEPFLVIKRFGIIPEFNLSKQKDWLEWEFPKDLEINYLVDQPLFNRDSPLGDVLSVSLCNEIFSVPYGVLHRALIDEELDYSKKYPIKDFRNGLTRLQELSKSKQPQFVNDKEQHMARQQELLRIFQTEYLGYYFKDLQLLSICCSMSNNDQLQFQRLELLGDAIIEVLGLYIARKILLRLGKTMTPEILHSVKAVALSRHGLASIVIFHKLFYCLKLKKPDSIPEKAGSSLASSKLFDYLMKKHFNDKCRDVNWLEEEAAPKELGDYLEALFGAILIDGGWEPVYNIFNRLFSPLIFFICKYFDDMVVDLIHDVNTFFATNGHHFCFETKKNAGIYEVLYCVTLYGEANARVIGKSINKDEGKARKSASVQAQNWINQELKKGHDFSRKSK